MPTIVQLPGNQTALLKDSDELSNRAVKELRRAARKVGLVGQKLRDLGLDPRKEDEGTEEDEEQNARNLKALDVLSHLTDDEDDSLDLFQRTCVVVRLIEWSLEQPAPQTVDEVDDLPRPIYQVLTTEAAKLDLNEDFTVEGAEDPKAVTEDSSASSPSSEEQPS